MCLEFAKLLAPGKHGVPKAPAAQADVLLAQARAAAYLGAGATSIDTMGTSVPGRIQKALRAEPEARY